MDEIITVIEPVTIKVEEYYGEDAGFKVITSEQEITLLIDNEQGCCEDWGYLLTEDDIDKFVGAKLLGLRVSDTNRSTKRFVKDSWSESKWTSEPRGEVSEEIDLDEGDVVFVDIETDRGILQFVAYNSHNGYYGHGVHIKSNQLTHEVGV